MRLKNTPNNAKFYERYPVFVREDTATMTPGKILCTFRLQANISNVASAPKVSNAHR